MIEFYTVYEYDQWHKVVRAILNGRPATAKDAVEYADYVIEQGRKRGTKLAKLQEQQHAKFVKNMPGYEDVLG